MKLLFNLRLLLILMVLSSAGCQQTPSATNADTTLAQGPVTTVYVVRHGEKETADPADKDPDLNADGKARAEILRTLLKDEPVAALFSTPYKRTANTLQPLADERGLTINKYEPTAFEALKNQVLQNYSGKTVVIAGHSNTILPIVEAFGVEKPVAVVAETKYDHIFKITIAADGIATLEAGQYGKATN